MTNDVFRKEYVPLTDAQKEKMMVIKTYADDLLKQIDDVELVKDQRYRALAVTHLENSIMWAVKAITG